MFLVMGEEEVEETRWCWPPVEVKELGGRGIEEENNGGGVEGVPAAVEVLVDGAAVEGRDDAEADEPPLISFSRTDSASDCMPRAMPSNSRTTPHMARLARQPFRPDRAMRA